MLRTIRSRCRRLALKPLANDLVHAILRSLPPVQHATPDEIQSAALLCHGSPGFALELLGSAGAKAFARFAALKSLSPQASLSLASAFSQRQAAVQDFEVFTDLLLDWLAREAEQAPESTRAAAFAAAHQLIAEDRRLTAGYNLDRRVAVLRALAAIEDSLKAA